MKKKLLSILLTVAMVTSLFSGLTVTASAAATYTITPADPVNGSGVAVVTGGCYVINQTSAEEGDEYEFSWWWDSGYTLDTISIYGTEYPHEKVECNKNGKFTMPGFDVTIKVTYKPLEPIAEDVDLQVDWSRFPSLKKDDNLFAAAEAFNNAQGNGGYVLFADCVGIKNGDQHGYLAIKVTDSVRDRYFEKTGKTIDALVNSYSYEDNDDFSWLTVEKLGEDNRGVRATDFPLVDEDELAIMVHIDSAGGYYFPDNYDCTDSTDCNADILLCAPDYDRATLFIDAGTVAGIPGLKTSAGSGDRYDVDYGDEYGYTTGGSYGVMPGIAKAGNTVAVRTTPDEGYVVDTVTWQNFIMPSDVEDDGVNTVPPVDGKYTFEMPASDVIVKVTFKEETDEGDDNGGEPMTYSVSIEPAENGTVTAYPTTAAAGDTVTLTVTPAICYELKSIAVEDEQGNSVEVDENNTFTMPESDVTVTAVFAAVESAAGIYPYGQMMTDEGLTLHIGVAGEEYLWQVADAADSNNWKPLKVEVEGELVDATDDHVTFTPEKTDLWYRCVVDDVPSEAVQAIQVPSEYYGELQMLSEADQDNQVAVTEHEFTSANPGWWYLSNGSMAYCTYVDDYYAYFDVVGKFVGRFVEDFDYETEKLIIGEPDTYWANTSYNGYWSTGSEVSPTPGYGDYANGNLKSIILNFDVNNDRQVYVDARLNVEEGYTAAAFGTDTELGNLLVSSDNDLHDDGCSLKAVFAGDTLKQIQMVAAESLETADPLNELSMVITPVTPNAMFWIGEYSQDGSSSYIGQAYDFNEGDPYYDEYYRKEGPEGYEDYVTEIQGADSALVLSWTGLTNDLIQFTFSVGTVAQTGASISSLDKPDGSIDVTVDAGADISVLKDGVPLVKESQYAVTGTAPNFKITFDASAEITCQSELELVITVSGTTTSKSIPNNAHSYAENSWEKDSTQHYQVCTETGCGYQTAFASHTHSWVQGATQHHEKCSVCDYTTTPADHSYVDGTCACGKAETPPAPAPSDDDDGGDYTPPTVDIPMSNGENEVDVKAEVSGKDATIKPLDDKQIDQLVGDENASGDVVIDLTDLGKTIDTAGIPKATLEDIVDAAEDAGNATEHLVIKLTTAELKLDDAAMRAIVDQAKGDIIKFNFDDVGTTRLNTAQKKAVKDMDVRKGFEAYITVNGTRISDFKGGNVEIIVPYAVPANEDLAGFSVWYIDEQGKLEKQKSTYDGKNKWFVVTHFSDYVIVFNEDDALAGSYHNCPKDETCPIHDYTDTSTTAWYHDGVHYCIDHGIMGGYGNGIFAPNGAVTRQQVWLTLARLSGATPANAAEARTWAMENGVSDGTNPTSAVTRQQFITMLYRYAKDKGYDVSVGEETNILSYTDAFGVAEYAIPAVQWGCGSGVMGGYTDGTLKPTATTTRAHLAAFLQRFCVSVAK